MAAVVARREVACEGGCLGRASVPRRVRHGGWLARLWIAQIWLGY
jgi:hypothetical protein